MLDLRRPPVSLRAARIALAALLTTCCACALIWATAPAAPAATGELLAFGSFGFNDDQFAAGGPVALDATDGNAFYVADLNDQLAPRLRKFSSTGTVLASVTPPVANPGGGAMFVAGLALDTAKDRLYVLLDADDHGPGQAREILVYSTAPQGGALVPPADVPSGVLIDFRDPAGGAVDHAAGLAVDPGTHKVAVLGVDDANASDPQGVLQYVTDAGALVTPRIAGLGAGLDPDGTTIAEPAGLGIAPDGTVYIATGAPHPDPSAPRASASIYRLPRESGTSTLFVTDTSSPEIVTGFLPVSGIGNVGVGSSIAVSSDGATVYLAEGDGSGGRVRGYATATTPGTPRIVYGGGTTSCRLPNSNYALGLAAGAGDDLLVSNVNVSGAPDVPMHLFGTGGTGCPRAKGVFTVDGKSDGITVTKGQSVAFDASASELLNSAPTQVDWDFDGSGAFATQVTGTPAALTTTHKFLAVGTFQVGLRVHTDGAPTTDPVSLQVKVVAPTPSASFKVSDRTPAAGEAVTFDAEASTDPAGSDTGGPSHVLAKYRWDFGDGSPQQETTTPTTTHAFANGGTAALSRTVKLTVVSKDDVASGVVTQTLTVAGTPAEQPPGPPQPPVQPPPVQQPPTQKPPVVAPPAPVLSAPTVDGKGATATVKVTCPAGGAACTGKVVLTVKVKQKVKGKAKTVTITLGSASFDVAAGKSGSVKVKLSAKGRALLKKQKKVNATAAVSVTVGGKTSTKSKTLTLKRPGR